MPVNLLSDPNVVYVLLVGGVLLAILALFSPGTGLIELGALFAIVLAGISISNMPVNTWALLVLVLGVISFVIALRNPHRRIFLVIAIAAFIIGSLFLFVPVEGTLAINPLLAVFVSVISLAFMWLIGTKGVEAINRQPIHDLEHLVGTTGTAETEIFQEGTVYAGGENWTARSSISIPQGTRVRIIGREGLILLVESEEKDEVQKDQVM